MFVISAACALIGLAVLVAVVPSHRVDPPGDVPRSTRVGVSWNEVSTPGLRRLLVVAGLLSIATIGDGFLYLSLADGGGFGAAYFPLLFAGTNLAYLALAVPLGRLADRLGRGAVLILGHVVLLSAYALTVSRLGGPVWIVCVLALLGTFYAATDGVLAALASQLVPQHRRASGIAAAQTVVAVGRFVSSVGFGVSWQLLGRSRAIVVMGAVLIAVLPVAAALLRHRPADVGGHRMSTSAPRMRPGQWAPRRRTAVLAAVVAACLVVSVGYFVVARGAAADGAGQPEVDPAGAAGTQESGQDTSGNAERILAGPHVVFRNTLLGPDYGKAAVAALSTPDGPRAILPLTCERLYATVDSGVCLSLRRGLAPTYRISTLDAHLSVVSSAGLVGIPSRTRISADGSLVATTTFVSGHDYATAAFSTQTILRRTGSAPIDLESWSTRLPDGTTMDASDKNYWGITFAPDDDTFFATAASAGTTWLVQGSVRAQSMKALRTDAECPSVSPDGHRIAYKKRLPGSKSGEWRLVVLDPGHRCRDAPG